MCSECDARGAGWSRVLLRGSGCPGDATPAEQTPHQRRDPVTLDLFPNLETVADAQLRYPGPRLVK
jgi:hypothetical protein